MTTIRTIINNAATILGMNNAERDFNVLLRCFNLMIAQVAAAARIPTQEYEDPETPFDDFPLSSQGLTYGLLAEYAFLNGMFNEARVWTVRFEQLLFKEVTGAQRVTLPRRRA